MQVTALLEPPGWVLGVPEPHALIHAAAPSQTRDDIQSMCGSHYMDGCQDCTGTGFSNCPKPLETLSRLCLSEPADCPFGCRCLFLTLLEAVTCPRSRLHWSLNEGFCLSCMRCLSYFVFPANCGRSRFRLQL